MNRDIITIGLSEKLNQYFRVAFKGEQRLVHDCADLSEARRRIGGEAYCLIVYNASALAPQDAADAAESLRRLSYAQMLVLTSDEAVERVLRAGADNCLLPETGAERAAEHARALIRRYTLYNHYDTARQETSVLYRGELMIDPLRHRVTLAGEEIVLQRREFRLLLYFAQNPGIVLTADQICENAFGTDFNYNIAPVIAKLRAKIRDDSKHPTYIETVYGIGYRFLSNG